MHFMPNNNLAENISHFILNAPTKKFLASKNCISNSWNSKIAFGEPGSRFPKVFLPCFSISYCPILREKMYYEKCDSSICDDHVVFRIIAIIIQAFPFHTHGSPRLATVCALQKNTTWSSIYLLKNITHFLIHFLS